MARVLVYGDEEQGRAVEARSALRSKGKHAVLRNPQYFNPSSFERDDVASVVTWDADIAAAYRSQGFTVDLRGDVEPLNDNDIDSDEFHSDGSPKVTYTEDDAAEQAEIVIKRGRKR